MRIALDAMGGDYAPGPNISGAIAAVQEDPELVVKLVGEQAELERLLSESGYSGTQIQVVPSHGVAGMDEKPMESLLKKPNCSIAVCWKLMAGREVEAVVSAGSTGAVVAAGLRTRLFLKGVRRPGIGVVLPTMTGQTVLLDVGANPGAKPDHLAQYAVMGDIYAREVIGIPTPRIGLMNIGSEEGKGTDTVRDTHALISTSPVKERFLGNVEGRDLYQGGADVIVCEGFVGNVVLKASEGMAEMMLRRLSHEVLQHVDQEKHLVGRAFESVSRRFSYHESGGAPLLGVDGICMICHGSSNTTSILNALRRAVEFQNRRINPQIIEALAAMPAV